MILFTIGYEGRSPETFLEALVTHGVQRVVDVRQMPLSHKAGFSKTRLGEFLRSNGIEYAHLPALGCPKDIRQNYHASQDFDSFKRRYLELLAGRQPELEAVLADTLEKPSCLMCFEADHNRCHRSFIAARLAEMSGDRISVTPIGSETGIVGS